MLLKGIILEMKVKARDFILFAELFAGLVLMEVIFRGATIGFKDSGYLFSETSIIMLMSLAGASLIFFFRAVLPEKPGKIIYICLIAATTVLFLSQTVYYTIFDTYYTLYSFMNGAQVVEFMDVIFGAIWDCIIPFIMITAVGIAVGAEGLKRTAGKPAAFIAAVLCVLCVFASIMISSVKDSDPASPYQALYGTGEIQNSVRSSGLLGAMGIDTWKLAVEFEPSVDVDDPYVSTEPKDNIIEELDFKELAEKETDDTIKVMHEYFGSVEPTEKNDKTGIFKGKNLIFITAESFSDMAIDPEYTPTLYKLKTEGYNFTNFYNPIWGVSTLDGEYVNLLSLVPKPGVWSMKESSENYLPFSLGHQFSDLGYSTKAYHNHSVYYYHRNLSHPNLGYDFKGQDKGYQFTDTWPESDLEMMQQTAEDFLTPDENGEIQPFHVYYLTVSGHLRYSFYTNDMAKKNKEAVKDMDMSDGCRAYMACNIELDKAVECLMEELDEAGELENTVIAIAGDHYPYGLSADEISEFRGHDIETEYEIYQSTMLLWTADMEPETVDKLCCNMDILPTLSNMFGLEYDSRLLTGKDIFSDSEGFVLFKDKNWISEDGTREELKEKDPEKAGAIDDRVADMFNFSSLVLDEDYYSYLKDKISEARRQ